MRRIESEILREIRSKSQANIITSCQLDLVTIGKMCCIESYIDYN